MTLSRQILHVPWTFIDGELQTDRVELYLNQNVTLNAAGGTYGTTCETSNERPSGYSSARCSLNNSRKNELNATCVTAWAIWVPVIRRLFLQSQPF